MGSLPDPPFAVYFHDSVGPHREPLRAALEEIMARASSAAGHQTFCVSFLDVNVRCIVASKAAKR
jgi:hypothetical protein